MKTDGDIRQGRCDFADYCGDKHTMVWTVGIDSDLKCDKKSLIKKTNIWLLRVSVDDKTCVWFDRGTWNKRPPLFGVARDAYKVILTLYS